MSIGKPWVAFVILAVVVGVGANRALSGSRGKGAAEVPSVVMVVDAAAGLPLVSPIGLASVFGDFARATTVSTSIPLNLDFDGFKIKFDGKPAALLGAFDDVLVGGTVDQANVQVPVDLDVSDGTVDVEIEWQDQSGKGTSSAFEVAAAPASPGIFELVGRAIVTNFSLGNDDVIHNSWAHAPGTALDQFGIPVQAAAVGGVITIWCSGLGPVVQPGGQPPLETGKIPPAGALFTEKEIRVRIDNQPAVVLGAVLQGTNVGLYQINAFVPEIPANDSAQIVIDVVIDGETTISSKAQTFISVRPKPAPPA